MSGLFDNFLASLRGSGKSVAKHVTQSAREALAPLPAALREALIPSPLETIADFGANPGNLAMRLYVPPELRRRPALVVVLHGCKQTVESYDLGSGWSELARKAGFLLLYPEQRQQNNPMGCFNWFNPEDATRGEGEPGSIRAMIETAIVRHNVDRDRIFICGLSAGGAMSCNMLALYPGLFKGGAIIAGLPFGTASTPQEAFDSMYKGHVHSAKAWGDLVRAASGGSGPWPQVAIWQGSADTTVKPVNAGELVKQWTDVHGLGDRTPVTDMFGTVTRRSWQDFRGRPRILEYSIPGLGHGTPIGRKEGEGALAPFFLPSDLWSSLRIAQDWGLFDEQAHVTRRSRLRLF